MVIAMYKEKRWEKVINTLDFAFQPIVNSNSCGIYGVEALLRNYSLAGFQSIDEVFDTAYEENYLYSLDLKLRIKALKKFQEINFFKEIKLFYNLDNRVLELSNFNMGATELELYKNNIEKSSFIFEISEKHRFINHLEVDEIFNTYKKLGFKIAIDDFGSGFANLQELLRIETDIVKIDRFFIKDIENSHRKQLIVKNLVKLIHDMGGLIIAEGVETQEEYITCSDLGCDLIQGYYVAKPTQKIVELRQTYM